MTISGPPMPSAIKHPRTADEIRESRRFWIAIWGPTAIVVAALVGTWPACSNLQRDVAAIKSGLEARDREAISTRNRVSDVEETAGAARKEAGEALAKSCRNEGRVDVLEPKVAKLESSRVR